MLLSLIHSLQYLADWKSRSLCLPLALLMFATVGADFACAKAEGETPAATPKNKVEADGKEKVKLFGRIDKLSAACAAAGVLLESRQMPTKILKVRLGSPASYAGLSVDDQVTAGTISGETMKLSIERNGKTYQVNLKVEPENISPSMLATNRSKGPNRLAVGIDKHALEITRVPDWRLLRQYKIAILLDHSGSMGESVLEGDEALNSGSAVDDKSTSRWRWCAGQIEEFAAEAQRMSADNLTFCIFNHEFTVNKSCDLKKMQSLLETVVPDGGTDIAGPINSIADAYLAGRREKPLLIGVVTDCETSSGAAVEKVIRHITRHIRDSRQVKIVIFQVGNTGDGADFAQRLDNDMVGNGARFDIVKSFYFDDLRLAGLRRGLVKAISEPSK